MSHLKCCLCLKPSNKFPDYFKTALTDFIQIIDKKNSSSNNIKVEKLSLCKSCWIYFMRVHQLDHELRSVKETYEAKSAFLSTKIRQSRRLFLESGKNIVASSPDLEVQISASKDDDDNDSNASEQTVGWDPAEAISRSVNNSEGSDDETLEYCETAQVIPTENDPISATVGDKEQTEVISNETIGSDSELELAGKLLLDDVSVSEAKSVEKEPTEATSDDTSNIESLSEPAQLNTMIDNESISASSSEDDPTQGTTDDTSDSDFEPEPVKRKTRTTTVSKSKGSPAKEPTEVNSDDTSDSESEPSDKPTFTFTFENKWLPKNITMPKSSEIVQQTSETDFLFKDIYPFQGTEFGFKCGLCNVVSSMSFLKRHAPWINLINHIKKWHMGDRVVNKEKNITQRCFEVGPDRFQWGKFRFEKVDGMYQCGECGVLKVPTSSKRDSTKNIRQHIADYHREKIIREYICEYCGVVYNNRDSLRCHKKAKHEYVEGQFPCSECGKDFVSSSGVKLHIKRVHLKQRDYICENCGKAFSHKAGLEIHVASVHNKEKMNCEECGKIFGSLAALNVHRQSSHKGKKYSCDICGMDFTQGYSVIRHKKTAHNV